MRLPGSEASYKKLEDERENPDQANPLKALAQIRYSGLVLTSQSNGMIGSRQDVIRIIFRLPARSARRPQKGRKIRVATVLEELIKVKVR